MKKAKSFILAMLAFTLLFAAVPLHFAAGATATDFVNVDFTTLPSGNITDASAIDAYEVSHITFDSDASGLLSADGGYVVGAMTYKASAETGKVFEGLTLTLKGRIFALAGNTAWCKVSARTDTETDFTVVQEYAVTENGDMNQTYTLDLATAAAGAKDVYVKIEMYVENSPSWVGFKSVQLSGTTEADEPAGPGTPTGLYDGLTAVKSLDFKFYDMQLSDVSWKNNAVVENLKLAVIDPVGSDEYKKPAVCTEDKGAALDKAGSFVCRIGAAAGSTLKSLNLEWSGRALNPAPQDADPTMNVPAFVRFYLSLDNGATWQKVYEKTGTGGDLGTYKADLSEQAAGKADVLLKMELIGGNATFGASWASVRALKIVAADTGSSNPVTLDAAYLALIMAGVSVFAALTVYGKRRQA